MGMTFSQLLPGFAGFAAALVAPWYSVDSGVIRNAIVFVLCFILLWLAIAVFQRSIKQKRNQAPKQGQAAESKMLQTLEEAIEEGRASLDLDIAASPNPHHLDVAASPNTQKEIPSPLAELALQVDKILPEPKAEHDQSPRLAAGPNGNGIAPPPPNPARDEIARASLPRLSELRGMRFSQALRELDKAKRSAPPNAGPYPLNASLNSSINGSINNAPAGKHDNAPNGALDDPINDPINEILMSAIAPFEPMFAPTAAAPTASTLEAQNGASAVNKNGAQRLPSQPTFFPARPALPDRRRSRREENDGRSPGEPKAPAKETNGFLDQLHILPSRRGQYKKKG